MVRTSSLPRTTLRSASPDAPHDAQLGAPAPPGSDGPCSSPASTLRATPERLLQDLNLLAFLFESLVIRDLRVYAQPCDAQVLHYKDNTDLEVDAVVEAADGRWAAFEIKLGFGAVDEGAESLKRFAGRIATRKCGPPRMLGVITGTGLAYTRQTGSR